MGLAESDTTEQLHFHFHLAGFTIVQWVFFRWFAANILFLTETECESIKMFILLPGLQTTVQFAYSSVRVDLAS